MAGRIGESSPSARFFVFQSMSEFAGAELACVRGERLVFERLDFRVAGGRAMALVGPNGSGKSSLLRLMAGLARPAAGRLAWDGVAVGDDPDAHRARLHYVGHLDALKPALSVAENLAFHAGLRGAPIAREAIAHALGVFDLENLASLPARFLSQGQRRRAALTRLVATSAPLWLLDEPTSGLDETSVGRLMAAIGAHLAQGGIAVVATHVPLDLPDVISLNLGGA